VTNLALLSPPGSEAPRESRVAIGSYALVLERTDAGGVLRIVGQDAGQPIEIEVTAAGPVLRLRSGLAIAIDGALSLDAQTLSLHARRQLSLTCDGTIDVRAGGDLAMEAAAHTITARLGDVAIRANDDVDLRGERIKLNG
jgi:adhesin HecA-like repeat protein